MIALCQVGDVRGNAHDDTGTLVPQHHRRWKLDRTVDHRHVAVTQPGRFDSHPNLTGAQVAKFDVIANRRLGTVEHDASQLTAAVHIPTALHLRWSLRGVDAPKRS